MKVKNTVKVVLSALLAVAFLYFAFSKIDWKLFLDGLMDTRWFWVLMAMVCGLGALVFRTIRWQALLNSGKTEGRIKFLDVWDAGNLGNVTSLVVPAVGEVVRTSRFSKDSGSFARTFGTVLIERAWDVVAVIVVTVAAVACNADVLLPFVKENVIVPLEGKASLGLILLAVCVLGVLGLYLVYRFRNSNALCRKAVDFLKNIVEGLKSFGRLDHKLLFLICTAAVWVMYVLTCLCVFKAIPSMENLDFADALFISAAGNFTHIVPVPGGMGAFHYVVALALSAIYGCSWEAGILMATLNHESHAILLLITGALSLARLAFIKRQE